MESASALGKQAASADPAVGLVAAAALRRLADTLEREQVRRARAAGWSWREIAGALHVSKQAVHQKYAGDIEEA
jgi:DNA invertase Pin-like site-specific DNA recombinase